MKMNELTTKANRIFKKSTFYMKKHSPEILAVVGIVGTVASVVMACKATLKVEDILDEAKDQLDDVHKASESVDKERYSEEDERKDTALIYIHTGLKLAKLYAPAVILGTCSLGSLLASNDILRKRNVALTAAYAAAEKSFKEYRGRVSERFGDEVERQIRYNIKATEIEETVTDAKGKEKTVKKTVEVANPEYSEYAKFFDSGSPAWEKDSEYNLMFLRQQQSYWNDKLRADGYVFLNDVYTSLGLERTKQGQLVGWVYDPECPVGDNHIDFGIYNIHREANRDFVNGYEPVILLDFNVDGNIWEMM